MAQSNYGEDQIQVLEGLEAVRKRPGMYIGSTSSKGLHHLVWEIVDNSIDEHLAGYCSEITLTIHKDNSISVDDNGRGIPVGMHKKIKRPSIEVVLTVLHAGGKFGGDSGYKVSGGLHGVGSSCVNALSEHMKATVKREGKVHEIEFEKGNVTRELTITGETEDTGTIIWFKPDPTIFTETTEYEYQTIHNRMRESAFLNPGLTINLIDERKVDAEGKVIQASFCSPGGVSDYVKYVNANKKVLHDEVIYVRTEQNSVLVEVALQYHQDYGKDGIFSYANNIKTGEGGAHETGFKTALTKSIVDYIVKRNMMKGDDLPGGDDTRVGLTAIVSVKVPEPQFEGQTKGKLGNSEVRPIVEKVVFEALERYFEENPESAKPIVQKVVDSFEERMAARKAREDRRKKTETQNSSSTLPKKLADCNPESDFMMRELFLVEGDSAGGSAKSGRGAFQAILPLRGKVLNVERATFEKLMANNEIRDIITAVGTDINEDYNYEKRRYQKVILMTDADVDGSHICILLLTFFFRYMRDLVEKGHIYLANPPLFKITKGKNIQYAYSDKERDQKVKELGAGKIQINRYKGLGEMNASQLWDTTMDPEKRTLYRVTIEDAAEAEIIFTKLMGEDPAQRREHIEKYGHEADIDT